MKNKISFFVSILIVLFAVWPAHSQNTDPATTSVQPLYARTDLASLIKAYWAFGNLDLKSDSDIDEYLMVSECSLYTQFFPDDFEWNKIREATRKYISANSASFPHRFEFIQPILLDRYDFKAGGFYMMKPSQQVSVTKLQVSGNQISNYPCLKSGRHNEARVPINAVLSMERPLSYTFVAVNQETADEYLKYISDNKIDTQYGRPAYIRYRFKVEQSLGTIGYKSMKYGNFFGSLESITVFGDKDMFIKMDERKY